MKFNMPTTASEWLCTVVLAMICLALIPALFRLVLFLLARAIFACYMVPYHFRTIRWRKNGTIKVGDKVLFQSMAGWSVGDVTNIYPSGNIRLSYQSTNAKVSGSYPIESTSPL